MANKAIANKTTGFASAVAALSLTTSAKTYIESNEWDTFGLMDSHLYRKKLFDLMSSQTPELSSEARFMIVFYFCVIKNRDRILQAMDEVESSVKENIWFDGVYAFIKEKTMRFTKNHRAMKKMPDVNIPSCLPGIDILVFCLITSQEKRNIETLKNKTTFSQLNLNQEMQMKAKEGYDHYWNNIVKGTTNPNNQGEKKIEPKARDEFYQNSASDKYELVKMMKDGTLKTLSPKDNSGYTKEEIERYLLNFANGKESI